MREIAEQAGRSAIHGAEIARDRARVRARIEDAVTLVRAAAKDRRTLLTLSERLAAVPRTDAVILPIPALRETAANDGTFDDQDS